VSPPQPEAPPREPSSDAAPPGASAFDFRHPAPLNEARLEAVIDAHQGWVEALSLLWSAVLPDDTIFELSGAGRVAIDVLCPPDAPPCHALLLPTGRRDAPVVVVVPAPLAHVMVDRLLGGPGELATDERPVTEIECRLIAEPLAAAANALAQVYGLDRAQHYETTADLAALELDSTGAVALSVVVDVTIAGQKSPVTVIVPAGSEGEITDALADATQVEQHTASDPESRRRAVSRLAEVSLDVGVWFAPSTIRSSEVLVLKVGDVVPLGTPQGGVLDLVIDGLRVALVRPARQGEGLACQVVAALDVPEPVQPPPTDVRPSPRRSGAS
jgi:flagellar motor switch protein FliM